MDNHIKKLSENKSPIELIPGQIWKTKSTIYNYRCRKHGSIGSIAGRCLKIGTI